jgi:cobalt/nickel transport protein
MPERKRKRKIFMLHVLLLTALLFAFYFFTLGPRPWTGVDETVVEKIAGDHGRGAKRPLIDPGEGDLLLFAFLCAGALGGFAAGYSWRMLVSEKGERNKKSREE